MSKIGLAILLLVSATSDAADVTLWRDIKFGMSADSVRQLYPARKGEVHHRPKTTIIENVQQVGRCHPDVHVEHADGTVTKVVIQSRFRGFPKESCGEDAWKALLAKYGVPHDKDGSEQETGGVIRSGLLKGLDTTRTERDTTQVWLNDGVLITFEREDPDLEDIWQITYEMPADIGL